MSIDIKYASDLQHGEVETHELSGRPGDYGCGEHDGQMCTPTDAELARVDFLLAQAWGVST